MRAVGSELDHPAQHAALPHLAGLTTSTRLDKFTRQLLTQTGLLGTIGKAERGPEAIAAIREFQSVYLIAVGGAAPASTKPAPPSGNPASPSTSPTPPSCSEVVGVITLLQYQSS
jgi:hypothetical protein